MIITDLKDKKVCARSGSVQNMIVHCTEHDQAAYKTRSGTNIFIPELMDYRRAYIKKYPVQVVAPLPAATKWQYHPSNG